MNVEKIKNKELKFLRKMALIQRQIGNVSGSLMFLLRGADGDAVKDDQLFEAMKLQLKTDLADMYKQCRVLAGELGFGVIDIQDLGDKRYDEAKANFIKKGKGDLWV